MKRKLALLIALTISGALALVAFARPRGRIAVSTEDANANTNATEAEEAAAPSPPPPPFKIAVFGDSTAGSLTWTLRGVQRPNVNILHLSKDGGTMLYDGCNGEHWAEITREVEPDVTLLFVGGAFQHELEARNGRWVSACHPEWDAKFEAMVSKRLLDLIAPSPGSSSSSPHRVFVLTVPPPLEDFGGAEFQEQVVCINKSLRRVVSNVRGIELLDLAEHICPHGVCILHEPNITTAIRPDGVHFHMDGAKPMSAWVLDQVMMSSPLQTPSSARK